MFSPDVPFPRDRKGLYLVPDKDIITFDLTSHLPLPQAGKQEKFYNCNADVIIGGGSGGGGKSFLLLTMAAKNISTSGYVAKIFRETATEITSKGGLKDKSAIVYQNIPYASYNQQSMVWSFGTGGTVSFSHSDGLDKKQLGAELAFVGIDEITNWDEDDFWFLLSRNRTDCGVKPQMVATCNPDPDSFIAPMIDWWINQETGLPIEERSGVVRYFYRDKNDKLVWADTKDELLDKFPEIRQQAAIADLNPYDLVKSFTFIGFSIYDNPIFIKQNPQYIGNLLMLDEVKKNRLLYGNWKISYNVGTLFNRNWFPVVNADDVPLRGVMVRFWDLAATDATRAKTTHFYTASTKIKFVPTAQLNEFDLYVLHSMWEQIEAPDEIDEDSIVAWSKLDGKQTYIGWEMEGGSAGKRLAKLLQGALKDFNTYPMAPLGNKLVRAQPLSPIARKGKIHIVKGEWNEKYLECLEKFTGKSVPLITDVMDSTSGAYALFIEKLATAPSKPRVAKSTVKRITY